MIRGETVVLLEKIETGMDPFGKPIITEVPISVDNVLLGNPSTDAQISELSLYGKRIIYVLGIPKGDTHDWKDKEVLIRGQRFRTYGFPLTQTEANVPGPWNTQVKVEAYE